MNKRILFEIPIYAMSEREFNKRWTNHKINMISHLPDGLRDEASQNFESIIFPRNLWKYNQIIGYIVISVSETDVWIDLYKSTSKERFHAIRMQKHYIHNMCLNGYHFRAENMDDGEIHTRIREMITDIEKRLLKKSMYVDYGAFDNVFDLLDIKRVLGE